MDSTGLRRIDGTVASRLASSWQQENLETAQKTETARSLRQIAHAFSYSDPTGKLDLVTEELIRNPESGLIRDAHLTTALHQSGLWLNRLRVLLHTELARELLFTLPGNASLVRVRLDGSDIAPSTDKGRFLIALPPGVQGQRLETLEVDYEVQGASLLEGGAIRPVLPAFGVPCLSFSWQVVAPSHWQVHNQGPGLLTSDSPPAPEWPSSLLGMPVLPWARRQSKARLPGEETLRWLDEVLSGTSSEELTFAEWFVRWDSGAVPLIMDRLALTAAGQGPRSRCSPVRLDPAGQSISLRTLQRYGLALVPLDGGLVITSQAEAARFDAYRSWRSVMAETLIWGSDRTDRFQTVARWRGEVTPREALSASAAESLRALPGWSVWQFTAPSWPDEASGVLLRTRSTGLLFGWLMTLLVVLGLHLWKLSPKWSITVPLVLLVLAVVLHLWAGEWQSHGTAGIFSGAMIVLLYRLGTQVVIRRPRMRRQPGRSGEPARVLRTLVRSSPFFLLALTVPGDPVQAQREGRRQIPILLPYDGKFDPGQKANQVVLRESDYQYLLDLARTPPTVDATGMTLRDATHRLFWSVENEALIESSLTLFKTSSGKAAWHVPVGRARDISASIDGNEVPIFVEAGGQEAAIPVRGDRRLPLAHP